MIHRSNQRELNHLLFDACRAGQVNQSLKLLNQGAQLTARNGDDWTPLHLAASVGSERLGRKLIELGADLNDTCARKWTPLMLAAGSSGNTSTELVKLLIAKGAHVNQKGPADCTAIHFAAEGNNILAICALLDVGAELNGRNVYGWTPMHWAAEKGSIDSALELLNRGALVNVTCNEGWMPLECAMNKDLEQMCLALIAHGADTSFKQSSLPELQKDLYRGLPPMHAACRGLRGKLVPRAVQLLKKGADMHALYRGLSALEETQMAKRMEVLAVLNAHQARQAIDAMPELLRSTP